MGKRMTWQYAGLGADLKVTVTSKENPSIKASESVSPCSARTPSESGLVQDTDVHLLCL